MKTTILTYDAIRELEVLRRLLDRRFHENISEEEFDRLGEVAEHVNKALSLIL